MEMRQVKDDIKDYIDDTAITTSIKAKFAADCLVNALDIQVKTNQGNVTLKGKVPSKTVLNRAKDLTQDVLGVNKVRSDIKIK